MDKRIFEPDFNMEDYIDKRLLEIESLKDKVVFKEVVGKLMLELCNLFDAHGFRTL